jgi:ssDNA-binding Zn-finger/Zn-ribbon topoisomerase 1
VEVRYRIGNSSVINYNGTEYSIAPCFFIYNKTELGINLIPESKEHKLVKNWIYNRIKNKSLKFKFSSVTKPYEYNNEIELTNLNIDYSKVGIEITVYNNKINRADVIIPFKENNSFFGCGIVIEVQFSKQFESTTERRSNEWAFKGYSTCWLFIEDFDKISEDIIELKDEKLKIYPLSKVLDEFYIKKDRELKEEIQIFSRNIDEKLSLIEGKIYQLKELNRPESLGECKQCHKGYLVRKKGKFGYFYGCSNYPNCKCIIKSLGDDSGKN